ncbi:GNAT family N-acetyltransferase [Agrobacterium tumefaciens]|uniref:GNAT family N-acetyltransferase n=1 Tax=Agrobacterium tumefaciens TaxID=358 RepID=UPI00157311AF|nr:GNAT family N-acetyltransferase [Agrobacterium tumefaciens]WCK16277.1 GNAT family N-acetyltransferase [Agrobacterium tumefaciens]
MNIKSIDIRPFDAAADTQILSRIWLDASLLAHPFIGTQRLREQQRLIEDTYLALSETFVAAQAGDPVGFISLLDSFIGGLFVAPAQQGKGIGRRLIAHALDLKGELSLEVYTANEQAMRFYRSHGFLEVSRRSTDDDGLPFESARLSLKA